MLHPTVFNTSEVCHAVGVRHAVISPGSRNAPLIISFARNPKIKKWVIPDERSAGFVALGIAQKLKEPVVLCCTSGTALLNYAPAIAEAYFREIPLIVLSADRPPELIDQREGQTIRQFEALKNHVEHSVQLPTLDDLNEDGNEYKSTLIRTLIGTLKIPQGPAHFNIPFREPFYPTKDQNLEFENVKIKEDKKTKPWVSFFKTEAKKVLIVVGQNCKDDRLTEEAHKFEEHLPIIHSPLSNLEIDAIQNSDAFLNDQEDLKPDLLITTGLSVLSKRLKKYLRDHPPEYHWHFDPAGVEVDTYQSNPRIFKAPLSEFLYSAFSTRSLDINYYKIWKELDNKSRKTIDKFTFQEFSESGAFKTVSDSLPKNIDLHLSNSMPVRYGEIFRVSGSEVWSNRGTSGIDGVTSTALGTSLVSDKLNVLLTGDISFLYDRNAFFHNHSYPNLRIVVFNNSGGGIFRLINGPSSLPELEEYFETKHNRTAQFVCSENSIEYQSCRNKEELDNYLKHFFDESDNPKLLEIFTDSEINEKAYSGLMSEIKNTTNGNV